MDKKAIYRSIGFHVQNTHEALKNARQVMIQKKNADEIKATFADIERAHHTSAWFMMLQYSEVINEIDALSPDLGLKEKLSKMHDIDVCYALLIGALGR